MAEEEEDDDRKGSTMTALGHKSCWASLEGVKDRREGKIREQAEMSFRRESTVNKKEEARLEEKDEGDDATVWIVDPTSKDGL